MKIFSVYPLRYCGIIVFLFLFNPRPLPALSPQAQRTPDSARRAEFLMNGRARVILSPHHVAMSIRGSAERTMANKVSQIASHQQVPSETGAFEPVPGPYGGTVRSLACNDDGWLYAATDGYVFRSKDNGLHWDSHPFPSQLFNFDEPLVLIGNRTIIAHTDFQNFISRDGGDSWNFLSEPLLGCVVDSAGIAYGWLSGNSGVKRSVDSARSWQQFALDGKAVYDIVLLGPGRFLCAADSGLYLSEDGGITWSLKKYTDQNLWSIVSDRQGTLFATDEFRAYKSADTGSSWIQISLPTLYSGEEFYRLGIEKDGTIFIIALEQAIVSSDGGNSWKSIPFPLSGLLTLGEDANRNLIAGSFYGVHRYNFTDGTWEELNNGIRSLFIQSISFTSLGTIIVSSMGRGFRSTDDGNTWSDVKTDTTYHPFLYSPTLATSFGYIFASASFDGGTGVLRSTDDGKSWYIVPLGVNGYALSGIAEGISNDLVATTSFGDIYHALDKGLWWSRVVSGSDQSAISSVASDKTGAFYAAKDSTLLISSDGIKWTEVPVKGQSASQKKMVIDQLGGIYLSSWNGILHSVDHGRTWSTVNAGLSYSSVDCMTADDSNNVFLGTSWGVMRLADSVDSWQWYSGVGFPSTFTTALGVSPRGFLFAGTQDYGMYRSVDPVGERKIDFQLLRGADIQNFEIFQNYPNPFNDQTLIHFDLAAPCKVEMTIYNILGQGVATLVSGNLEKGGYSVKWNPTHVCSGLYFCRLLASEGSIAFNKTIKIMYVR